MITLQRGFDITKKEQRPGPVPVISSAGPSSTHDEAKVQGPGVVIGRKGTLGTVHYSEHPFWPHDTTLWVKDFKGSNPLFVFYFLQTLGLGKYDVGASNPTLNRNHLHLLPVRVPDEASQRSIAAVLRTYDALIANSMRRVEILEAMAQAIYREWFVEFHYPGHENVRFVDSELGPVPKGWAVRRLADEATVVMGQSPKSEFYNDQGTGLPFHQGVTNFGLHFPTNKMFSTAGDRKALDGDILFSVRAPVGRINVSTGSLILGRGLCAIRPDPSDHSFVLYQLRDRFRELDAMGSGAIFNAVKRSEVENLPILWPLDDLRAAFVLHAAPMFDLVRTLTLTNRNLKATRDLLLPRLISGEVDALRLDLDLDGLVA